MKPDIDLSNPLVKAISDIFQQRADVAYSVTEKVELAVRPVFLFLGENKYPKQIGSCVMLRIDQNTFALSASHVFEEIGNHAVLVACGEKVHQLTGERYSTMQGPSGSHQDDPIDASVLHLNEPIPEEFHSVCLTLDDLALGQSTISDTFQVAVGYRSAKSGRKGKANICRLEKYPTIEHRKEIYASVSLNHEHFIAIAFEDQVLVGERWLTSPSPRGMSGGGIFSIAGLPMDPSSPVEVSPRAKLVAITTERKKKSLQSPQIVIGTRIGFHLGLIEQYNPGLVLSNAP